jgi:hypothetical protein
VDPPWAALSDDELLRFRLCDLDLRIEGSEIEPRVAQLYAELDARGISFHPRCFLGDEWFSPGGVPEIAVPFYLAHPRLKQLELRQMLDVEGGTPETCQRILRHECGHAIDHAYRFSRRRKWHAVFESLNPDYEPSNYRPRPHSKSFVRHLPNWYAQAHPDEDFAETFAVWLGSAPDEWRGRYRGWKALEKLEYVDALMREVRKKPPLVSRGRRFSDARKLRRTLAMHYTRRRKQWAEDFPDFYDADLRRIFAGRAEPLRDAGRAEPPRDAGRAEPPRDVSDRSGDPAGAFMKRHGPLLIASLVHWTGQRKYTVTGLVKRVTQRAQQLELYVPEAEAARARARVELAVYLATLVTNHLHTGKFKRSV